MKKLFISCPMKGRTEENIRASMQKMHKIAEATLGEELEVIPSYIEHRPPENSKEAIWYLGESIKKLSEADIFICVDNNYEWSGCYVEQRVAHEYGIPAIEAELRYVAPDALEILERACREARPVHD
jgi:hypothetical protein